MVNFERFKLYPGHDDDDGFIFLHRDEETGELVRWRQPGDNAFTIQDIENDRARRAADWISGDRYRKGSAASYGSKALPDAWLGYWSGRDYYTPDMRDQFIAPLDYYKGVAVYRTSYEQTASHPLAAKYGWHTDFYDAELGWIVPEAIARAIADELNNPGGIMQILEGIAGNMPILLATFGVAALTAPALAAAIGSTAAQAQAITSTVINAAITGDINPVSLAIKLVTQGAGMIGDAASAADAADAATQASDGAALVAEGAQEIADIVADAGDWSMAEQFQTVADTAAAAVDDVAALPNMMDAMQDASDYVAVAQTGADDFADSIQAAPEIFDAGIENFAADSFADIAPSVADTFTPEWMTIAPDGTEIITTDAVFTPAHGNFQTSYAYGGGEGGEGGSMDDWDFSGDWAFDSWDIQENFGDSFSDVFADDLSAGFDSLPVEDFADVTTLPELSDDLTLPVEYEITGDDWGGDNTEFTDEELLEIENVEDQWGGDNTEFTDEELLEQEFADNTETDISNLKPEQLLKLAQLRQQTGTQATRNAPAKSYNAGITGLGDAIKSIYQQYSRNATPAQVRALVNRTGIPPGLMLGADGKLHPLPAGSASGNAASNPGLWLGAAALLLSFAN